MSIATTPELLAVAPQRCAVLRALGLRPGPQLRPPEITTLFLLRLVRLGFAMERPEVGQNHKTREDPGVGRKSEKRAVYKSFASGLHNAPPSRQKGASHDLFASFYGLGDTSFNTGSHMRRMSLLSKHTVLLFALSVGLASCDTVVYPPTEPVALIPEYQEIWDRRREFTYAGHVYEVGISAKRDQALFAAKTADHFYNTEIAELVVSRASGCGAEFNTGDIITSAEFLRGPFPQAVDLGEKQRINPYWRPYRLKLSC